MDHWLCPGVRTPAKIECGKSSVFEPEQNFDRKKICILHASGGKRPTNRNFNNAHRLHNSVKLRFLSLFIGSRFDFFL